MSTGMAYWPFTVILQSDVPDSTQALQLTSLCNLVRALVSSATNQGS